MNDDKALNTYNGGSEAVVLASEEFLVEVAGEVAEEPEEASLEALGDASIEEPEAPEEAEPAEPAEASEAAEGPAETFQVTPDRSSRTRWARPARSRGPEAVWHGYSYVGAYAKVSYCGVGHLGSFRRSPPPSDNAVCERCAEACGFVRRSTRHAPSERQRGSRRLGNIVQRLEVAVERMERVLARVGVDA